MHFLKRSGIDDVQQWLRTANTCPVCREKVKSSPKPAPRRRPFREASNPPDGASSSTFGNGGRPSQTNTQGNHGRPVSFAIVFDRMMNEARDPTETWPSSMPGTRDVQSGFRERLRAREQQRTPHGQDVPFHMRMPPVQPGPLTRPSTSTAMATDGRPLGFVPLLRGQGSDSSISTDSSSNMVVDEVGPSVRRPIGGPGSMFLERTQPSFDAPTVVISSSNEWRAESRSSSRPMMTRLPIHEDSPSEEYMFGWHLER